VIEHFDVLIVGAGISGVSAAYHLQRYCPDRSYAVLEARAVIGGTWDLFRYPGIRSDSDMHTLGFAFEPWTGDKSIADGAAIRDYVQATARKHGIDGHVRHGVRVAAAAWSTPDALWTVDAVGPDGEPLRFTCGFLSLCAGYYDYAGGHMPTFPGVEEFQGRLVHPQHWPDDMDYADRDVVVIGSGATAVTLVPAMTDRARHVTMLQRSPTYVVSRPAGDATAARLRRFLPATAAYRLTRWKNVLLGMIFYRLARRKPQATRERLLTLVREALGSEYDVGTHFTPSYDPWDQRLCLIPDGDLFDAIRSGRVEVVTDRIETFTSRGIRLASGRELSADVVVAATGLELLLGGGVEITVDGKHQALSDAFSYRGMMFSNVPNLSSCFGYINASWTLKADLTARYVCRLLNAMRRRGLRQATPRPAGSAISAKPFLDFTSGYVQRAASRMPKQGQRKPWQVHQNYALDWASLRLGSIDREMKFTNPGPA